MKVALFDNVTKQPMVVVSSLRENITLTLQDSMYSGYVSRVLDGTTHEGCMSLVSLPTLTQFDSENPNAIEFTP